MGIDEHEKLLLDIFGAIEQRNELRFRQLIDPDFEIHWPPSSLRRSSHLQSDND